MAENERSSFAPFLIDEHQKIGAYEVSPTVYAPKKEEPKEKAGFGQTFKATLGENFIARKYKDIKDDLLTFKDLTLKDEKHNPLDSKYLNLVSPEYWPEMATATTDGGSFRKASEINTRIKNKEIKDEGSTMGWIAGEITNAATNPFYYMPLANGYKAITFMPAARNILTKTVPEFMLGEGLNQADLYFNHQATNAEDAIKTTMVAGLMGGIFGGIGFGARTLKMKTYKSLVEDMASGKDVKFRINKKKEIDGFTITDDSVGAASTKHLTLVGESLYGFGKNGELHAATPLIWGAAKLARNPVLLGLTSKSPTVRKFINETLTHNFDLTMIEKDLVAPPASVQSLIDNRRKNIFNFQTKLGDSYYEYLGIDPEKNFVSKFAASKFKDKTDLYDFKEFSKQFYLATVEGGVHSNPTIQRRSQETIKEFFEPITKDLVDLKLLSPDVSPKMAVQHVMRVYNTDFISGNRNIVKQFFSKKFAETNEKVKFERKSFDDVDIRLKNLKDDLKSVTNEETKKVLKKEMEALKKTKEEMEANLKTRKENGELSDDMFREGKLRKVLDDNELTEKAEDTILNILGLNEEQMNGQIAGFLKSGSPGANPLKERVLMISDKELIEQNILNPDMRVSFSAYSTRMSRLIEMEKYLRAQGYNGEGPRLDFLTNSIKEDYKKLHRDLDAKHESAIAGKEGKELEKINDKFAKKRIKLEKSQRSDMSTSSAVYNRLMGQSGTNYGSLLRSMNAAKKYLYATELGSMTLLMLQDLAVPVYRQGFKRYFENGIIPFVRNVAALDFKANARLKEQAKDLGLGIDTLQAFYNMNFDLNQDTFIPLNFIERLSDKASNAMGIANLSNAWGDAMQHLAATGSSSSIIRDLQAFSKGELDEKWVKRLLNLRIDPKTPVAKELLHQATKHGEYRRGAWLHNVHMWDNADPIQREARALFETAVRKDVQSVMFSGSNIASYPIGGDPNGILGLCLMYMGWGFNATANFTIPMFQKMNSSRLSAALAMISISSIVDPIRKLSHGEELTDEDLDGAMMFKKGLLNSGILGLYGDMFNKANSMGDLFPGARINRYKNTRGLIQFGPERILADLMDISGMFINQEWNKKDWKKVAKNVPLANLIYTRAILNDWIDSFNIPETRHKASKLKEWR